MASEELNKINEDGGPGYTSWSPKGGSDSQYMYPTGRLGRWFAKFFATPAKKAAGRVVQEDISWLLKN